MDSLIHFSRFTLRPQCYTPTERQRKTWYITADMRQQPPKSSAAWSNATKKLQANQPIWPTVFCHNWRQLQHICFPAVS